MSNAGGVKVHPVRSILSFYIDADKKNLQSGSVVTADRYLKIYVINGFDEKIYALGFEDERATPVHENRNDLNVGDYVSYYDEEKKYKTIGKITKRNAAKKFYVINSSVNSSVIIPFPTNGGRKTLNKRKKNKKSRKARKSRNKYFFF